MPSPAKRRRIEERKDSGINSPSVGKNVQPSPRSRFYQPSQWDGDETVENSSQTAHGIVTSVSRQTSWDAARARPGYGHISFSSPKSFPPTTTAGSQIAASFPYPVPASDQRTKTVPSPSLNQTSARSTAKLPEKSHCETDFDNLDGLAIEDLIEAADRNPRKPNLGSTSFGRSQVDSAIAMPSSSARLSRTCASDSIYDLPTSPADHFNPRSVLDPTNRTNNNDTTFFDELICRQTETSTDLFPASTTTTTASDNYEDALEELLRADDAEITGVHPDDDNNNNNNNHSDTTLENETYIPTSTSTSNTSLKPFARPPFPSPVPDRSPILGLTSTPLLRICFRIGEAINAGATALRTRQHVIIELFARVRSSHRGGGNGGNGISSERHTTQFFVLQDLFHARPPYLRAVYKQFAGVKLWERDSAVFLGDGDGDDDGVEKKMCRCLGTLRREEAQEAAEGDKYLLVILNIWEATTKDVEYAKGIVFA